MITQLPDQQAAVSCIRNFGWWQGSVVPVSDLAEYCAAPAEATHWIVASQTCNIQHGSLDLVPSVELIAATLLKGTEFSSDLAKGERPRILHTCASGDDGQLFLALQVHDRHWIPRVALASCAPSSFAIEDLQDDAGGRYKEIFASWLGRSYTRLELPNDFNEALAQSGIKDKVFSRLRRHDSVIQGIYLSIATGAGSVADEEDAEDIPPLTPSAISKATGPYLVDITVVVQQGSTNEQIKEVRALLAGITDRRIPIEKLPEHMRQPGETKCTMADVAASKGLTVGTFDVVTVKAWTVHDLMRTVRFTDYDYLSNVIETDDA